MRRTIKVKLTRSDIYVLAEGLEEIKRRYDNDPPKEFLFGKDYLDNLIRHLCSHLDKFEV